MNLNSTLILIILAIFSCSSSDDSTSTPFELQKGKITQSIQVDGVTRDYIIYIPESYNGNEDVPLLFAFHGLGGSMESSYNSSKFYEIAERENFIVVHPNGLSNQWNAFTADDNRDVDFVEELITMLLNNYQIDSNRIYSTGMSNGGYFSFLLACELSDKIAGIASVTGLMFENVYLNCQPSRPIPIMQIHGTNDLIVNYDNVQSVLNFWIDHNNTNTNPIVINIPDIDATDGSTVEKFVYGNGDNHVEVQHYKIDGGRHQWPGYRGNMDINTSEEIWHFLKQFDLNGKIE